jgi:hypothetical protein
MVATVLQVYGHHMFSVGRSATVNGAALRCQRAGGMMGPGGILPVRRRAGYCQMLRLKTQ